MRMMMVFLEEWRNSQVSPDGFLQPVLSSVTAFERLVSKAKTLYI